MTQRQLGSATARLSNMADRTGGPNACWPWRKTHAGTAYGRIRIGHSGYIYAHRLTMALLLERDLTPDEFVMHTCDNPPCCNPLHLILGDIVANNADARAKGRLLKPTCRRGHEKTPENTYEFMQNGYLHRQCKQCASDLARQKRQKRNG